MSMSTTRKRTADVSQEGVQQVVHDHYSEDSLTANDMLGEVVHTLSQDPIQIIHLKPPTFVYKKTSITSESKSEHL